MISAGVDGAARQAAFAPSVVTPCDVPPITPNPPCETCSPPRTASLRTNAGWIALAALLLFVRKTDSFLNPQFWAEDAWPFFVEANTVGPAAFLREYNGYHHFLPRLIAWAAAHFDPALQPAIYVFSALVVTLIVVAQALSSRLDLPGKPLLALAVVLVPHTGEVLLTPTNLQWITALGLLLTVCTRDPATPAAWCSDLTVIFAFGFTGPFSLLLAPVFLLRACQRRTAASWILLAAVTVPALVQGWSLWHSPALTDPGVWHFRAMWGVISVRSFTSLLVGGPAAVSIGYAAAVALAVLIFAGSISLAAQPDGFRRARFILLAAFTIFLVAAVKRARPDTWASWDLVNGDRYWYAPKVILLWLIVLSSVNAPERWRRWTGGAFLLVGLLANAPQFRIPPAPDLHWAGYCPDIRAGRRVAEIPINPGWKITYPGGLPVSCRGR